MIARQLLLARAWRAGVLVFLAEVRADSAAKAAREASEEAIRAMAWDAATRRELERARVERDRARYRIRRYDRLTSLGVKP